MKALGTTGDLLAILRDGAPHTKTELAEATGLARSTIALRLEELLERRLITEADSPKTTGGRPSIAYEFLGDSQYVLAVDLDAHSVVLAIANLRAEVVAHWRGPSDFDAGPFVVIPNLVRQLRTLMAETACSDSDILGMGIGVSAPVDFHSGRVNATTYGPAWDDFDLAGAFAEEFNCPAYVDNDANVLAVGEQRTQWPEIADLMYVKLGSGIGGGIISHGELCRGADGASGDLSHVFSVDAAGMLCVCGNIGCVGSLIGGYALARRLTEMGFPATSARDVAEVVRTQRNPEIARLVREAARGLGSMLATCISVLNPSVIVIGGDGAKLGEPLLAGIREAVYGRAQAYASRNLQIVQAQDSDLTGVIGAVHMVLDLVLDARQYTRTFAQVTA